MIGYNELHLCFLSQGLDKQDIESMLNRINLKEGDKAYIAYVPKESVSNEAINQTAYHLAIIMKLYSGKIVIFQDFTENHLNLVDHIKKLMGATTIDL